MDDYGYYQHHATPYPLNHSFLALPSPSASSLSPSAYSTSNASSTLSYFSDQGLLPTFDQFQYDHLLNPTDQKSLNTNIMVNEGFDQFDPLYASSLQLPNLDNSPISPIPLQVCGRPSFDSSESIGRELFGSPLLWSDDFVTNGLDTGEALLLHHQMPQPVKVISDNDVSSKEYGTTPSEKDVVKTEDQGQSGIARRSRKRPARQMRETDTNSVADSLTWEILSQYFYMPIAQAARELNIGLTLFKKRCRELGVRRWPHRKLMSIQSLIKNVKEMEKDGGVENPALSKDMVRNAIEVLENQKKMMEVMPDIELEDQTKRLRQACFKANYKKRRLMIMNGSDFDNSSGSSSSKQGHESIVNNNETEHGGQDLEESDELKSLLFDSISPADCSFLNDYM